MLPPPLPRPLAIPLHAIFVVATKLSSSDWYGTINHLKEQLAKSAEHKQQMEIEVLPEQLSLGFLLKVWSQFH